MSTKGGENAATDLAQCGQLETVEINRCIVDY
jgi:hypothetical protein